MPDANSERKSTVSVVVPTYYRPKELGDLFDSLLNQSIRPFEVVIVDDTPTKAVRNLCEDFETKFRV
ncbi:MAG TPA: glycosyltransferase, partial [Candidatus Bathyarchaeia archaeon]|nr:glycosyltransferase [Candidatus Bathyarchaeia archaeon]